MLGGCLTHEGRCCALPYCPDEPARGCHRHLACRSCPRPCGGGPPAPDVRHLDPGGVLLHQRVLGVRGDLGAHRAAFEGPRRLRPLRAARPGLLRRPRHAVGRRPREPGAHLAHPRLAPRPARPRPGQRHPPELLPHRRHQPLQRAVRHRLPRGPPQLTSGTATEWCCAAPSPATPASSAATSRPRCARSPPCS